MGSLPIRRCSVEGCENKRIARGFCQHHYNQKKHAGTLKNLPPKTLEQSFSEKVDKDGPYNEKLGSKCWIWLASDNGHGYGRLFLAGERIYAHRWSYIHFKGQIPRGKEVDHMCNNSRCVNPDHLQPLTHKQNVLRGSGCSARQLRKTHCKYGHVFDLTTPKGYRDCSVCRTRRYKERWQRAKARREGALG